MAQNIPTGKQQFFDINGNPLVGGKVFNYLVSTTTPKNTFQDAALTIPNTNPVILDARGQCVMFGSGNYRQVLQDANGVQIWDQVVIGQASLLNVQTFTVSGSYAQTPGTTSIIVEVQGAGGAGGGAPATGASVASLGAPGGAGAYAKSLLTSGFAGAAITVGAGGVGVSGGAGGNGGLSAFGAISCPGGSGGTTGGPAGSTFEATSNNSAAPTGGNIVSYTGGCGSLTIALSSTAIFLGTPGSTLFGAGPRGGGGAAVSPGAGGAATGNTASLGAKTGGNGGPGIVIVWEYS